MLSQRPGLLITGNAILYKPLQLKAPDLFLSHIELTLLSASSFERGIADR